MTVELRRAVPGDYGRIAAVVDDWWGRQVLPLLRWPARTAGGG
ncbi:hypothetical protein [Nonomuraea sp. NPDC003804]